VSALEFAAAIKWPVTVLILAVLATVLLKHNPGTRQSMGAWFNRRNLRLHVAGQEFEATLAETQGSMDLAAGNDAELAATVGEPGNGDSELTLQEPNPDLVEAARRTAVERVLRNAVQLGYQWAGSGSGWAHPVVDVEWTESGHPTVALRHDPILVNKRRSKYVDELSAELAELAKFHPELFRNLNSEQWRRLSDETLRHFRRSHGEGDAGQPQS
jgi:hypothetical protein